MLNQHFHFCFIATSIRLTHHFFIIKYSLLFTLYRRKAFRVICKETKENRGSNSRGHSASYCLNAMVFVFFKKQNYYYRNVMQPLLWVSTMRMERLVYQEFCLQVIIYCRHDLWKVAMQRLVKVIFTEPMLNHLT